MLADDLHRWHQPSHIAYRLLTTNPFAASNYRLIRRLDPGGMRDVEVITGVGMRSDM